MDLGGGGRLHPPNSRAPWNLGGAGCTPQIPGRPGPWIWVGAEARGGDRTLDLEICFENSLSPAQIPAGRPGRWIWGGRLPPPNPSWRLGFKNIFFCSNVPWRMDSLPSNPYLRLRAPWTLDLEARAQTFSPPPQIRARGRPGRWIWKCDPKNLEFAPVLRGGSRLPEGICYFQSTWTEHASHPPHNPSPPNHGASECELHSSIAIQTKILGLRESVLFLGGKTYKTHLCTNEHGLTW